MPPVLAVTAFWTEKHGRRLEQSCMRSAHSNVKDCTTVTAVTNVMLIQGVGKHNVLFYCYWNVSQKEAK